LLRYQFLATSQPKPRRDDINAAKNNSFVASFNSASVVHYHWC